MNIAQDIFHNFLHSEIFPMVEEMEENGDARCGSLIPDDDQYYEIIPFEFNDGSKLYYHDSTEKWYLSENKARKMA